MSKAQEGYYGGPLTDQEAARFLQQAQFTSTKNEISSVKAAGYTTWLKNQFSAEWNDKDSIVNRMKFQVFDRGYKKAVAVGNPTPTEWVRDTLSVDGTFHFAYWYRILSPKFKDQMRWRMALALSEFFVIRFASEDSGGAFSAGAYMDLLAKNAFGSFKELLKAVTLSYPMGYFLSTLNNTKGSKDKSRLADENFAREIMQLFTIGLCELNINGAPKTSNGEVIETYTLNDVRELAKIFTGYTYDSARFNIEPNLSTFNMDPKTEAMTLDPEKHDFSEVTFLKKTIPESLTTDATTMAARLDQALDILVNHPNVGPFFVRQMIQRLVTSNPTPEYIRDVALVFNDNGYGQRGDLKAVWTAILTHNEARSAPVASNPISGKLREPLLMFIQWARTCGLNSKNDSWKIESYDGWQNGNLTLFQFPLKAPSVFNFFRPDYSPTNINTGNTNNPDGFANSPDPAINKKKLNAPEFQILNDGNLVGFINFISHAIYKGLWSLDPAHYLAGGVVWDEGNDMHASYANELKLINNDISIPPIDKTRDLINYLNLVFAAGQISNGTVDKMVAALLKIGSVKKNSSTAIKKKRIRDAVLLVMMCPEYAIQK